MPPFVSIIIPTYNGGDYLVQTVASALAQVYPDKEVIVIDDGSTDNICSLLIEFGNKIRYFRIENSGPGGARKRGVAESKGDYLAFLDHDDLWSPQKISLQIKPFIEDPSLGLVYSYPVLIDEKGDEIPNEIPSNLPEGYCFEKFLRKNRVTTFSATLIKASTYHFVGGIDDSANLLTCDDYDLWLRISYDFKVKYVPGSIVYYRIHPNNMLKNHYINMESHLNVLSKCKKYIQNNKIDRNIDSQFIIRQNLYDFYRKFAFIFYYSHNDRDTKAAQGIFKKAIWLKPNVKLIFYYFMTFSPFVVLRKVFRKFKR